MFNDVLFLLAELRFPCDNVWIHTSSLVSLSEPFLHWNAKAPCKDAFQFPPSNYYLFLLHNFCLCGLYDCQHPPSSWSSMTPCFPLFPACCINSTPFSALILHLFSFSQFPLQFSKSTSLFLISFSSKGFMLTLRLYFIDYRMLEQLKDDDDQVGHL
jgi:hypothetical protein